MVRSETRLRGSSNEVIIGWERPAVIISQLIPAHRKGGLADPFRRMDFAAIAQKAAVQVQSGADVLEMHIEDPALDEATYLPAMVKAVAQMVPVPLCVGARDPKALAAALAACPGKPLAYLIDQGTGPWRDFLAVAERRGAAVIAQAVEPDGVPATVEERI
jgi:5-methyltetrahydrofolate--homocysteine methyltransferase